MINLVAALIAFIGTHFLMSHPLRAPMVKAVGTISFQIIYSLVSLLTFAWVYFAYVAAPRGPDLWAVGEAVWIVASVIMWAASILLTGSFVGNPAMPRPDAAALTSAPARGVFAVTRHPMMWSFALWALAHGLVAPHVASLHLVGGIALLALGGSWGQDHKKAALMGDGWRDWASRTSFVPFGNQIRGTVGWASIWPGTTIVLIGTALWLLASWLHPLQGAPVVGIWRWL